MAWLFLAAALWYIQSGMGGPAWNVCSRSWWGCKIEGKGEQSLEAKAAVATLDAGMRYGTWWMRLGCPPGALGLSEQVGGLEWCEVVWEELGVNHQAITGMPRVWPAFPALDCHLRGLCRLWLSVRSIVGGDRVMTGWGGSGTYTRPPPMMCPLTQAMGLVAKYLPGLGLHSHGSAWYAWAST